MLAQTGCCSQIRAARGDGLGLPLQQEERALRRPSGACVVERAPAARVDDVELPLHLRIELHEEEVTIQSGLAW